MEGMKVLVVDDEDEILDFFRRVLMAEGFVVDTASTAGEALEKVRTGNYDACLLDINLPDMHGTELLRQIHGIAPSMKKLMVSGDWIPSDVALARKNGADEFVAKPLNRDALLDAIHAVLSPA